MEKVGSWCGQPSDRGRNRTLVEGLIGPGVKFEGSWWELGSHASGLSFNTPLAWLPQVQLQLP